MLAPIFQPQILEVQDLVPIRLPHLAVLHMDSVPLQFVNVYILPRPSILQARLSQDVSTLWNSIDPGECIIPRGVGVRDSLKLYLKGADHSGIQ